MNAYVIGKLNHLLPLQLNAPKYLINKLHKVIMTVARTAIGNFCFKKSTIYILDKLKWLNIDNMIIFSSLCYTHKIIKNKSTSNIFKTKKSNRAITKWYTIHKPKTLLMKIFSYSRHWYIFMYYQNQFKIVKLKYSKQS